MKQSLNGIELDRRLREILMSATRETVLSSTAAVVELGFSGLIAFKLVSDIILAKERQ